MKDRPYDFIIVGSGAGGGTLARELSQRGKRVLIVDRGKAEQSMGTTLDSLRYYDVNKITQMPIETREGVMIWRAFMAGGSTGVSCGNGVRALEKELAEMGLNLKVEFDEAEMDIGMPYQSEALLSDGSRAILKACHELGLKMEIMPKFIDPKSCRNCGKCVLGCPYGAKWAATSYLFEAYQQGAEAAYQTRVSEVIVENDKAVGVRGVNREGEVEYRARSIVLAAGGLGTPVILQHSGIIEAGEGLFLDLFVNTYGVTDNLNLMGEPSMMLVDLEFHDKEGFLISPFVTHSKLGRLIELGPEGAMLPSDRLLGLMTKIIDEPSGKVFPDGLVSKAVTPRDRERLDSGATLSKRILLKAGADPDRLYVSHPQGAHPGGTAAIGKIVDINLETSIRNLFVCDASVLPVPPGLPPILTLVALAKHLAKRLI
jgi:choline dehydrogenase-like flavoprotein